MVNKIGLRLGLVDRPSPRKQHNTPKVRIGGITIIISYISVLLLNNLGIFSKYYTSTGNSQIIYIIIGGILIYFVGFTDDIKGSSPWSRLLFQFIIASFLWSKGIALHSINFTTLGLPDLTINLNQVISFLITVIWLVGITNALQF